MQARIIPFELYQRRQRQAQDTNPKPVVLTDQQISRYLKRVIKGRDTDCWLFQANSRAHYPKFDGFLAHRVAYFIYKGQIPEKLTIDHLCNTRWCQNPAHLEAVTRVENARRYNQYRKEKA